MKQQKLVAKSIDGKKIREQYFDGLLLGFFIFVIGYTIWCFLTISTEIAPAIYDH